MAFPRTVKLPTSSSVLPKFLAWLEESGRFSCPLDRGQGQSCHGFADLIEQFVKQWGKCHWELLTPECQHSAESSQPKAGWFYCGILNQNFSQSRKVAEEPNTVLGIFKRQKFQVSKPNGFKGKMHLRHHGLTSITLATSVTKSICHRTSTVSKAKVTSWRSCPPQF